jgi:hypothetical protein
MMPPKLDEATDDLLFIWDYDYNQTSDNEFDLVEGRFEELVEMSVCGTHSSNVEHSKNRGNGIKTNA